jgi:hypothetical protein
VRLLFRFGDVAGKTLGKAEALANARAGVITKPSCIWLGLDGSALPTSSRPRGPRRRASAHRDTGLRHNSLRRAALLLVPVLFGQLSWASWSVLPAALNGNDTVEVALFGSASQEIIT